MRLPNCTEFLTVITRPIAPGLNTKSLELLDSAHLPAPRVQSAMKHGMAVGTDRFEVIGCNVEAASIAIPAYTCI